MSQKRSTEKWFEIFVEPPVKNIPQKKIRIVIEGLQGEDSIVDLCRRESINSNIYYR